MRLSLSNGCGGQLDRAGSGAAGSVGRCGINEGWQVVQPWLSDVSGERLDRAGGDVADSVGRCVIDEAWPRGGGVRGRGLEFGGGLVWL